MTINIISDLHAHIDKHNEIIYANNEFDPSKLEPADVLVIAGDLGLEGEFNRILLDIKRKTKGKFKKYLAIKGNHDYYQYPMRFFDMSKDKKFVRIIDDVVFIGTTLWSPIIKNNAYISFSINDYKYIPDFTTDECNRLFALESGWLSKTYDRYKSKGYKVVIVTHHVPRLELVSNKFVGNVLNDAFVVSNHSLDWIHPNLWIHGHSHEFMDMTVEGTRYLRNPIGYSGEIKDTHWYNTIVEV